MRFIGKPERIVYVWRPVYCCLKLEQAISSSDLYQHIDEEDNHPFITLYDNEDYARDGEIFYCPFCGTKVVLEKEEFPGCAKG